MQEISLAVEAIEPFRDGADDFQAEARWARVAAAAPPSRSVTGDYVWHVFMQIAGGCMSKPAEAAIDETRRQYVGAGGDFIDEDCVQRCHHGCMIAMHIRRCPAVPGHSTHGSATGATGRRQPPLP